MKVQSPAPQPLGSLQAGPSLKEDGRDCKGAKSREENRIRHPGEWDSFLLEGPDTIGCEIMPVLRCRALQGRG